MDQGADSSGHMFSNRIGEGIVERLGGLIEQQTVENEKLKAKLKKMMVMAKLEMNPWTEIDERASPAISVVVCTRNRGNAVVETIESILACGSQSFEIVVVDQSDNRATEASLAPHMARGAVNYICSSSRGVAAARNVGIRSAQAELIALTDDDCLAGEDWPGRMAVALSQNSRVGIVHGNVLSGPHDPTSGFIPAYRRDKPFLATSIRDKHRVDGIGACMGLRKQTWCALGGFDEALGAGALFRSAEEFDFGVRALLAGIPILETPEPYVVHRGFRSWTDCQELVSGYLYGIGAMFAKHLKCGCWPVIPYIARLGLRWLFAGPAVDFGRRPSRAMRLTGFLKGISAGFRRPVYRARQHYVPPSCNERSAICRKRGEGEARDRLLDLLQKCSLAFPPAAASVWLHGETPEQFDSVVDVISGLVAGEPQLRLVLTSNSPATVAFLRRWLPGEQAGMLPWGRFAGRYMRKVNPSLIVLLDGGRSFGRAPLSQALCLGVQVAVLGEAAPDLPENLLFVRPDKQPERVVARLRPFVPQPAQIPSAEAWMKGTLRDRFGQSRAWRQISRWLTTRRIDDWETLRERLGRPRAVLCLGNGPSAEDPRLAGMAHDCLIRVNWRWRSRGLLTRPQMVFVGDAATVYKVPACIFGFWNQSIESAMLLRHLVTRGPGRMEYVTLEQLSPLIGNRTWPARPTNGALMIVTAAGLAPERLIIGGMDLFQHPQGRYPGDRLSRNEPARSHSREVDLGIIDLALRDYRGKLVILSDILRESLERYREKKRDQTE